jgi:hypothetical protein
MMAKTTKKTETKEYAPSVGFWPAKSGRGYTVFLNADVIATLEKAEEGGTLFLQEVPEEWRKENTPHYRVSIFAPRDEEATAPSSESL